VVWARLLSNTTSGFMRLDDAAVQYVRENWVYWPTNGRPMPSVVQVRVTFRLNQSFIERVAARRCRSAKVTRFRLARQGQCLLKDKVLHVRTKKPKCPLSRVWRL
jgi:hypothetical protein